MRTVFSLLFFIITHTSYTQNLVPNGSFEDTSGTFSYPKYLDWRFRCTVDYYNSKLTYGDSKKFDKAEIGRPAPRTGNAYVGVATLTRKWDDYREYAYVRLKKTLVKNERYIFSAWVYYAGFKYATDGFGALFTHKAPHNFKFPKGCFIDSIPQVQNARGNILYKPDEWILITDTITATGTERFLTLGSFLRDKETMRKKVHSFYKMHTSYYLIDDVSLIPFPSKDTIVNQPQTYYKYPIGKPFVFKHINFEFDSTVLLPQSFIELDSLANHLLEFTELKVEIHGHTDSIGYFDYNIHLSEGRAQAVFEYFIKRGIAVERMVYFGHGSTVPVTTNDTEEGRWENRRVEFILKE